MRLHPVFLSSAALVLAAATPMAAQGRIVDEGTLLVSRPGSPTQTESFRIRVDGGVILATGQLSAGGHRVSSALRTDSLGTPLDYKLEVRDNGAPTVTVSALAGSGRLTSRSQLAKGDESTREYPVTVGNSVILDDDLLHQTYFVALNRRTGTLHVIAPRAAHGGSMTVTAHGMEPLTIGGRSVTGMHYSLGSGASAREFWVDSEGRLLQVEIPSAGIKAVREELPR